MASRILYAWELGAHLGHVGPFIPLGRRLRAAGAEVSCALAPAGGVARLMASQQGFAWTPAPVFRGHAPPGAPVSYADILLRHGYGEPGDLLGLVEAWRRLITASGATLVLADHAPTAILAARTLGAPVMLCGAGFYAPPDISPLPAMRPWAPAARAGLEASEAQALAAVNAVLDAFGGAPLARLGQVFDVAETGLNTLPELDAYAQRRNGRYWGMLPGFAATTFAWPPGVGPCVFGYLRAGVAGGEAALTALRQARCRAFVCCPDAPADWHDRFGAPHLVISREPVDLVQVGREADAAVLYASHGATAELLRSGIPMVLTPENLEQGLTAWRVQALGAGFMVGRHGRHAEPAAALAALLTSADCKAAAMAFARRHAGARPQHVAALMAARALGLASGRPLPRGRRDGI